MGLPGHVIKFFLDFWLCHYDIFANLARLSLNGVHWALVSPIYYFEWIWFFFFTRFVQFIKKRLNKSPTRYRGRNYAYNFEPKLRYNFTHTQPTPTHWHNHTPHTHTQTNVYENASQQTLTNTVYIRVALQSNLASKGRVRKSRSSRTGTTRKVALTSTEMQTQDVASYTTGLRTKRSLSHIQ